MSTTPINQQINATSPAGLEGTAAEAIERKAAASLFIVVTFLLVFIMAARTPLDTDLWWHLHAGDETLRTGQPLLSDPFSFTRFGAHWINHSWLSQVGMALLYRWGGFLGLGGMVAVLVVVSMVLVYRQCAGPVPLKSAAILLGSVVASTVWSVRPQLTSLVLFTLVAYLLYLYKWRGQDRLWWLLPVFVLWSNLHGGYVLGLLLIGAMLAGEVLNHVLGIEDAIISWRGILRLALIGVLCGFAVLLNPNGLDTWRIPFQTINVGALQQFIPEWASPDFHDVLQQSLLWLLLMTMAAFGLSGKRIDGSELVTLAGFAYMALLARRNYGPFALVAVPILTRYAAVVLQNFQARASAAGWLARFNRQKGTVQTIAGRGFKKAINLTFVALLGLVAIGKLYTVTHPALVGYYLDQQFPVQAAGWLAQHQPNARLFNEYDWGGYLSWRLPSAPIFVDGRTDLFGDAVIGDWITTIQAGPGWQAILERYQPQIIMIDPERPLNRELAGAGWQVLYQDSQTVVYGRP